MRTGYLLIASFLLSTNLLGDYAWATAPWHVVRTVPATPIPGQAFLVEVEGTWPNGCPFSVSPLNRDGHQLRVRLTEEGGVCTDALRPYQLSIDPAPSLPHGLDEGAFELYVEVEDRNGVRSIAFDAFSVHPGGQITSPEPGFWVADPSGDYPDSGSGVGFNLERQEDAVALIAYFYDTHGEPRWYFSAGDTDRSSYAGDLLEIRGGQSVFHPYQPPRDMQSFGRIHLNFSDRGHAVAWFSQPEDAGILAGLRIMPISLVRFGFKAGASTPALSGRWVLVSLGRDAGSGTVIDLQPDLNASAFQVRLHDPRNVVSLDCGVIVDGADRPPPLCVLTNNGEPVALDSNGINELRSADGGTRLIRINP